MRQQMTDTSILNKYLDIADSRAVDVLVYLLKQRDENNYLHVTLDMVAEECEVTKVTVNKIFQKLYSEGFMVKVRNGFYEMHPDLPREI